MDIGSILLLTALIVIVGAFIASPLRGKWGSGVEGHELDIELSELLSERERVLEALTELDFDNEMGKVPDDLYPIQRESLLKRGAAVLRLLDEHQPPQDDGEAAVSDELAEAGDDPLEQMILARKLAKKQKTAKKDTKSHFCPECGENLQPGDKFCPGCGHKLS